MFEVVQMQRRQTTEISDDTDCGAWPQAGEVQTPTVQQDDILDTALCHHLRRFVHHLPTICGVQWSNLSSLIYSVFLLLSCSCLWSILVQCDRGDQPRAANCPRSVNTDTGGEGKYFLVDISRIFSVHLSFTIDEVQSMRLRMKIGFILINDFAERRWVGDVFFMLTLLPSIASVQPPAELTIMINAAAPLIHFVINTHIHTTLATRQYFIIINVQSSQYWVQGQEMSVAV